MAQIFKRGSGWAVRINYRENGKRRTLNKQGFKTKKEAQVYANEMEIKKHRGSDLYRNNVTLKDIYQQYIEIYKEKNASDITAQRYRLIGKVIDLYFPNRKIVEITKSEYQDFINNYTFKKKEKELGLTSIKNINRRTVETVRKTHVYIYSAVQMAVDDQIIYSNFCSGAVFPKDTKVEKKLKYLQVKDLSRLTDYLFKNSTFDATSDFIILTGALTGARLSEILALTWDDIDLEENTISINKSWDYVYTNYFKPTKTESSIRKIGITNNLSLILRDLKIAQMKRQLNGWKNEYNLVFRNKKGYLPSPTAISKRIKQIQKELLIRNPITFHGLRHTHASYLISKKIDIFYISKRLGHKNVLITQKIYSHLLEELEHKEEDKTLRVLENL